MIHERETMADRLNAMWWIFMFAVAVGCLAAALLLGFAVTIGHLKPAHLHQFVEVEALLLIIATLLIWCVKYLVKQRHARPPLQDL
jgi:high-affinity Fe2+/Pb2+ permease